MKRCDWCTGSELYINYHDTEWGVPVYEDNLHFEFLTLESAQSGLSWITILKKRENYRHAYDNFDIQKVAHYDEKKMVELLSNAGIVRNRMKIEASIVNARKFIEIQNEFGSFTKYIWAFTDGKPIVGEYKSIYEIPSKTHLSDMIAKDMKKKGFKFLGSVTIYSHLQAAGIVNDHTLDCFRYKDLTQDISFK